METEVRKVEMSENIAGPTGLGLLGLAVVCFVVSTSRVGWSELFISLLGFYGSGAVLVNKVFGKTVFPMGKNVL